MYFRFVFILVFVASLFCSCKKELVTPQEEAVVPYEPYPDAVFHQQKMYTYFDDRLAFYGEWAAALCYDPNGKRTLDVSFVSFNDTLLLADTSFTIFTHFIKEQPSLKANWKLNTAETGEFSFNNDGGKPDVDIHTPLPGSADHLSDFTIYFPNIKNITGIGYKLCSSNSGKTVTCGSIDMSTGAATFTAEQLTSVKGANTLSVYIYKDTYETVNGKLLLFETSITISKSFLVK